MQAQGIDYVNRAIFSVLPRHLQPLVERRLRENETSETWQLAFTEGVWGGRGPATRLDDLSVQLRLLAWTVAGRSLTAATEEERAAADRVRRLRNHFAHTHGAVEPERALRVLGAVRELLDVLELADAVAEIDELHSGLTELATAQSPQIAPDSPSTPVPIPPAPSHDGEDIVPTSADDDDRTETTLQPGESEAVEAQPGSPLDQVTVDKLRTIPELLVSSALQRDEIPLELRLTGGTVDLPHLRVSIDVIVGGEPITLENDQIVSLGAGGSLSITARPVIRRRSVLALEQRSTARVRIVLSSGGERRVLIAQDAEFPVFGVRSWRLTGHGASEHSLAAFVQPQQPEIAEILRDAASILAERTGSAAMNAYQGDERRTAQIVDAICSAVHARRITYANPPVSWAEEAQEIRSAASVFADRAATCLDSTVLLASAFEQAGIDTQLWLLHGHIVLAWWGTEDGLQQHCGVHPSRPLMSNLLDSGAVHLIETTMLTAASYPGLARMHQAAFESAGRSGIEQIVEIIDIAAARRHRIFPLPVLSIDTSGDAEIHEYRAPERDIARLVREALPGTSRVRQKDADVPPRIAAWKNELLDLTLRNRLINLTPKASVPLAVPADVHAALEDMLHAGTKLQLIPPRDRRDERLSAMPWDVEGGEAQRLGSMLVDEHRVFVGLPAETGGSTLQKLSSNARLLMEQTGSNSLFLTIGDLHWRYEGRSLISPLILMPVTLVPKARSTRFELELDPTGSSGPNHSLLQRLLRDFGLRIPGLEDPETDGAGIDIDGAIQAVRSALTEHELDFSVRPSVRLGLFNSSGYVMWKDLEDNWRTVLESPLVRHLVHTPTEVFEDPVPRTDGVDLDDLVSRLPTATDASQAEVIADAVHGRTLVVEGPPGTGKSQTITNLIVHAMAEGRKVLFVAEKQAALEVVSRRLAAVGLSDLVLNLHDSRLRPTAVKAKVRKAIDMKSESDDEGLRTDRRALATRLDVLKEYSRALHTGNRMGLTAYSARTTLLSHRTDVSPLPVDEEAVADLDRERLESARTSLREAVLHSRAVDRRPDHPWMMLNGPVDPDQESPLVTAVLDIDGRLGRMPEPCRRLLEAVQSPEDMEALAAVLGDRTVDPRLLDQMRDPRWRAGATRIRQARAELVECSRTPLSVYQPNVIDGHLDEARTAATEARGRMFGRSRALRKAIGRLAAWERPGVSVPDEAIETAINELLALRHASVELARAVNELPGMHPISAPALLDPSMLAAVIEHVDRLEGVLAAHESLRSGELGRRIDAVAPGDLPVLAEDADRIAAAWREAIRSAGGAWACRNSAADGPLVDLRARLASGRGDEVSRRGLALWNALLRSLQPLRDLGLGSAVDSVLDGGIAPEDIPSAFDSGLAAASLRERLGHPVLRSFDGKRHDALVDEFDVLGQRVRDGERSALRARILAHRRTGDLDFQRRSGMLRREVSGRARAPQVRTLMSRFGDVVTEVMPCVLVSPESASRFIPLGEQLFDIVIFDEASQITVASAIAAMGRGRSAVIVGDSRQMPPTRFATISASTDQDDSGDDEEMVPDEESILGECVQALVDRRWLSNHYRSRTEDLIAFSNGKYYENRLATFPGPGRQRDPLRDGTGASIPGVRMRRVDGAFLREGSRREKRTNPIEAQAIVDDVIARFEASEEEPSIGIVTFNIQQRELIESLLREQAPDSVISSLDAVDGLFVKNLENVQGDERDTILFSIAFSANERGEVPLNFGPLNREGGERRLNVAVTRARVEVLVFCSFDPSQLHAERSSSVGLQHVRAYLDFAAAGASALTEGPSTGRRVDRHREDIAGALRERGLRVETDIGLSGFRVDLGVGPADGDLVMAIMLDGDAWHRRATAADRDLLPRSVLAGIAGWPAVERVWLPDWVQRRSEILDGLVERVERTAEDLRAEKEAQTQSALEVDGDVDEPIADVPAPPRDALGEAGHRTADAEAPSEEVAAEEHGAETAESLDGDAADVWSPAAEETAVAEPVRSAAAAAPAESATIESTAPETRRAATDPAGSVAASGNTEAPGPRDPAGRRSHKPWAFSTHRGIELAERAVSDHRAAVELTEMLISAVDAEYPLTTERAAKLVLGALGLRKVRSARVEALWQAVRRDALRIEEDGFVWPGAVQSEEFTGFRSGVLRTLPIEELHSQELRNAAQYVRDQRPWLVGEELLREIMHRLGARRLTENIRLALVRAVAETSDPVDDRGESSRRF